MWVGISLILLSIIYYNLCFTFSVFWILDFTFNFIIHIRFFEYLYILSLDIFYSKNIFLIKSQLK